MENNNHHESKQLHTIRKTLQLICDWELE